MTLQEFRDQFQVLSDYTYLNTASSGLISKEQMAFRRSIDESQNATGSIFREPIVEQLYGVQQTVAHAFGGNADRVALVQNYSTGMNAFVESLGLPKKVLTDTNEYPSVVMPFESRGHHIVGERLGGSNLESVMGHIEIHKPDILAVSLVQWMDGRFFNPNFVKTIKEKYPDLIIVCDGTQYMGTAEFNFETSGVDLLISSAYKWLTGGYGCGFMMFSESILTRFKPKQTGNIVTLTRMASGRNHIAQLYQPGHLDYVNFGTMKLGIDHLQDIGWSEVRKQINGLALHLKTSLVNMGFISHKELGSSFHSGILNMPGTQQLVDELRKHDILVSLREGIRVSYHAYNTEADINRFIQVLKLVV